MSSSGLFGTDSVQRLKLEILADGIELTPSARRRLSADGTKPLVCREYATTGGLTLRMGDVFVNAPLDEWFCDSPKALLIADDRGYRVEWTGVEFRAEVLPLPSYLGGGVDGVMTHADRARLSPIEGCACACAFCDSPHSEYRLRSLDSLLEALKIALAEPVLPARHVLVSGGTPRLEDEVALDALFEGLLAASDVPVDIMLMPRRDNSIVDRLRDWDAHGLSVNLEVFDTKIAASLTPHKNSRGHDGYADMWDRAVAAFGPGKVRSLLLVGLEPQESVLKGVEFIASHGVDPVLSPFRPAAGTTLAGVRPPSADTMERVYERSLEIADRYGVKLGPRCLPCQHNTIAFSDGSPDYVYT